MLITTHLKSDIEKFALESNFKFAHYPLKNMLQRMESNFTLIVNYSNELSHIASENEDLVPGTVWILDNFYKVEEQVNHLRLSLSRKEKLQLGILTDTVFKGYPRIYPLAIELIKMTNGNFDENAIIDFLKTYQNVKILSIAEIWAFSTMLTLAVIEKIAVVTKEIHTFQLGKLSAQAIDSENPENTLKAVSEILENTADLSPVFIESLVRKLNNDQQKFFSTFDYLETKLKEFNTNIEKTIEFSHISQSSSNIFIGNLFTSLNKISMLNWHKIFEDVSVVENMLKDDPSGIYNQMDFHSRNYYRKKLEKLAEKYGISETKIAMTSLKLSNNNIDLPKKNHVGYYIIANGKKELLESIGLKERKFFKVEYSAHVYIFEIALFTTLISLFVFGYIFRMTIDILTSAFLTLLFVIPISDVFIKLLNYFLQKIFPAAFLPKLDLSKGIPADLSTFSVFPTLITSEEHVKEMFEKIEQYYLGNKFDNLYFALLGEFPDANSEFEKYDNNLIKVAINEVKALNKKYPRATPIFYYFQRKRQYNAKQEKWICWERKRGSLTEFNNLISGDKNTSHIVMSSDITPLVGKIKYIITLDEDTQLPIDSAYKLIGTIAHPLNEAVYDEKSNRVIEGYGIIQPHVCIGLEHSCTSKFTQIYARSSGQSIYIEGFSDLYQDVFSDGIFFGKGIYNLELFSKILNKAIPQNKVLSHDLLEGSHIRAAFTSDISFIDTHPTKYISYLFRLHRWIRGDWQLIGWLSSRVKNYNEEWIENPLSILNKWEIFDNLRRSLNSICLFIILIGAFTFLPKPIVNWIFLIFIFVFLPVLIEWLDTFIFKKIYTPNKEYKQIRKIKFNLKGTLQYTFLQLIFLPFEAAITLSAIAISLYRTIVTKKYMLEWTTAAIKEKETKYGLKYLFKQMKIIYFELLFFLLLVLWMRPENLIFAFLLALIWASSPYFAYLLDKTVEIHESSTTEEIDILRKDARHIWSYYEDLSTKSTHYLPPDNFQVYPPKGIAERTSPTNIGLGLLAIISARDMGFLSITRMIQMVNRMLLSIDKMEKWEGHLYNWYSTKNLSVLRPRYVSSVDSGNLVGYLMVLKESLIEYKNKPVIDDDIVQGLRETCELTQGINKPLLNLIDDFGSITGKTADEWIDFLNNFIQLSKSCSKKTFETVSELIHEHHMYFTLFEYKDEIGLSQKPEFLMIRNKIGSLRMDMTLIEVKAFYVNILMDIKQKKRNPEYDAHCINLLENKIKSIICNFEDILRNLDRMAHIIDRLVSNTKFDKLFDFNKNLFSIGYDCENNQLTNSYYDLIASESRITSLIAILTKQVPADHWYKLSRTYTLYNKHRSLASWSGTMFEYFMPSLIMKTYPYSIFDETYHSVITSQKNYGKLKNKPWGVSESSYYFFDLDLNYQYKAFGVPNIGFKRGLINDYVVSPYSSYFALNFDKKSSLDNLDKLRNEGAEGIYGLYEAIDYTRERIGNSVDKKIVQSYMAHHLGMSLLSINNFLNDNIMQKRFHANPLVKMGELFLQEKLPYRISIIKELKEKERKIVEFKSHEIVFTCIHSEKFDVIPHCHIISNKNYNVMIANNGIGYSQYQNKMITRFRSELDNRYYGYTFYFKNIEDGSRWSIGNSPIQSDFKDYEVRFSLNKAEIVREDHQISTHMDIWVSPEDNVEMRKITLLNKKNIPVSIEITSFAELVLNMQDADLAHPAFNNLFISTEFDKETQSLIAVRKPRDPKENETYVFMSIAYDGKDFGSIQYETNRNTFIGRGRNLSNPIALDKLLDNTEGVVLEPILSLRKCIQIDPHQKVEITFEMGVSESRSKIIELIAKYKNTYVIKDQLDLSAIQSQVEMTYLDIDTEEINIYQNMISQLIYINPNREKYNEIIRKNNLNQCELWKYGISGDVPIILISIKTLEHKEALWTLIKGKEYWKLKGLPVNLVILNNEEISYYKNLEEEITDMISKKFGYHSEPKSIGVFVLNNFQISDSDRNLLYASANVIIDCELENLFHQTKIKPVIRKYAEHNYKKYALKNIPRESIIRQLKYFNGYGGFCEETHEYIIKLENNIVTPLPWINVISNDDFGCIISENGGGYTWSENSNENKLTPWLNDTIFNNPQEVVFLRDETYGELWSLTPDPLGKDINYEIHHGKGYTKFISQALNLDLNMTVFVPLKNPVKIFHITIKNMSNETRNLSSFLYVNPVLGTHPEKTKKYIITEMNDNETLKIINPYNYQYPNRVMYLSSSEILLSYTGNKAEFSFNNLLHMDAFKDQVGGGFDPCGCLQISLTLKAMEEKEFIFTIGQEQFDDEMRRNVKYYRKIENVKVEFEKVQNYWKTLLNTIQIQTPDNKFDVMINGWLPYQTIACRIKARSAFYQTGGAFGYRDQLQDALNMILIDPELTKRQILLHAAHQFPEGDVLHWWHPGVTEKGIRTRFSDDLLWLPYVVSEYLTVTEDYQILDQKISYVTGDLLEENENETYFTPGVTSYKETLYLHCIRAIEKAMRYGVHGIPLMGGGDWNDGMNEVGIKGKGESIWLGWFLGYIVKQFIKVCEYKNDSIKKNELSNQLHSIVSSIEKNGWDGSWYKRAYYDDGTPLGSIVNSECMIDSLPQSWAVISGLADKERMLTAMNSVRNHLILKDKGMILLFTPPFDKSEHNPGYIKSYAKGLRENGGQYTHASAWVIYAYALLGEGSKAFELYQMLNPVNHTRSIFRANHYKVEPYAISADVYNVAPHIGRGGWSWYTGASGWMYRVAMDSILGIKRRGDKLMIEPCIPNTWQSYTVKYRFNDTFYNIEIINEGGLSTGTIRYVLDGQDIETKEIEMVNDHIVHNIKAYLE
ncbi:MAG: glycosyl transferase [Clostridiales bacterium]|nr:glycosyl transferase [Clostridiales bacterium]